MWLWASGAFCDDPSSSANRVCIATTEHHRRRWEEVARGEAGLTKEELLQSYSRFADFPDGHSVMYLGLGGNWGKFAGAGLQRADALSKGSLELGSCVYC